MEFPWTPLRQNIFLDRYALRRGGIILEKDPSQMWDRVASAVAIADGEYDEFRQLLDGFGFLPGGRILSGAGSNQHSATWYNCFVLGINPADWGNGRDSRDAIMSTISKMVEINCRGGGVGINWSVLRPDRSEVRGVHGTSTGSIGWMRGADSLADQVRQGGSRTAALMFVLNDWHPDIMAFVRSERFKRANFSVAISSDFMSSLRSRPKWTLKFPNTSDPAYDLLWDGNINKWEHDGRQMLSVDVDTRLLWSAICESAILGGNPGLVFIDRCNSMNTSDCNLICTNPCGEQPLPEYGSCNLGSINLVSVCSENGDIDKKRLSKIIRSAVKFLDNVIEKSPKSYSEIDGLQRLYRRIGLGTMGLADVLMLNKIRYGSGESISFISELYRFICEEAFKSDSDLASERGAAPAFSLETFCSSPFGKELGYLHISKLRNTTVMTQAPTGTVSILAGVSSGIEPVFSGRYIRKDATGEYAVEHPLFKAPSSSYHVTAYDVAPEEHIAVQSEIQRYVDSSISKTVNLPPQASAEDADRIFRLAYDMGCKGITIYRGGSPDDVMSCKECVI